MKKENIIIAEFMERDFEPYQENYSVGVKFKTFEECRLWIEENPYENKKRLQPQLGWGDKGESYENSWNALMPVIEKISALYVYWLDNDGKQMEETFKPYPRTFGMKNEEGKYMFRFNVYRLFIDETLIGAAYAAVVDFLITYKPNENKPPKY